MTLHGGDLVLPQWCFLALLWVWGKDLMSSASHTFLRLSASLVCTTLCTLLSLWCPYLGKESRSAILSRTTTAPSTFILSPQSGRQTTSLVCLCCEKHLLIHGLATSVVNSAENSLGSISFQFVLFSRWKLFVSFVLHQSVLCHSWACNNKLCYCTRPYHIQLWTLF